MTIREALETLPEPYRKLAIENANKRMLDKTVSGKAVAVALAFDWSLTPQGAEFWQHVSTWASKMEQVPQLPPLP